MPIKSVHDELEKRGVVVSRFLSMHGKGKGTPYLTSVIPLPSRARVFSKEADGVLIYFEEKPLNEYLTVDLIHDDRHVGFAIIMQISYTLLRGQTR